MINATYAEAPDRAKVVCDEGSVYKMPTVLLDASNLPAGYKVPHLCPINVDWGTCKATLCKRVRLFEAVAAADTTIKVEKGHAFVIGDYISEGETTGKAISAISYGTAYDTLTVTIGAVVAKGAILHEVSTGTAKTEKSKANFMFYGTKVAKDGDTVTPVGQVYSIREANLTVPVTAGDKGSLSHRFMFI